MPFKTRTISFNLEPSSIDDASSWFVENQESVGIDPKEILRARLLLEEALLNLEGFYGAEQTVSAFFERRWRRYRLRLVIVGEHFNPLKRTEDEQDSGALTIFDALGMNVQYSFNMGANVLRVPLAQPSQNPVLKIALALLVGAVVGLIGNILVPDAYQEAVVNAVLEPISDMWVRLLQMLSGPIIFFMAINAAMSTKRITERGGSRFTAMFRYFGLSIVAVVFALLCSWPFFPVEIAETVANGEVVSNVLDEVLHIIPGNLVEPFLTANTPQLLLVAIAIGYILASMGDEVAGLKSLMRQANILGLTIARQTSEILPYFVGLLLCLRIWSHNPGLLGRIWIPLLLSGAISLIVAAAIVVTACTRFQLSPLLLVRKLRGPFVETIKLGSLDLTAIDTLVSDCRRLLGIDGDFARAALPQGLVLYMPTSAVGIMVFLMFAAHAQQVGIDQVWVLTAVFLAVALAVATPPVTGANLLAFVMAFANLGISNDAILDVMVFDIVFGVFCFAIDQALLQVETLMQAKRLGFLNEEKLRAPLE